MACAYFSGCSYVGRAFLENIVDVALSLLLYILSYNEIYEKCMNEVCPSSHFIVISLGVYASQ